MSAAAIVEKLSATHEFAAALTEYLLLLGVRQEGLASLERFHQGVSLSDGASRKAPERLVAKSDLRESFKDYASPELARQVLWWKTTSGTSGRPVDIPYDAAFYLDFKFGVFHKAWYLRRQERLGDRPYLALVLTDIAGEASSLCVDPLYSAGVVARISIDVSDPSQVAQALRLIEMHRPDILSTKPSVLAALVMAAGQRRLHAGLILAGGAALNLELRKAAGQLFGGDVTSIYATSEVGVVASECSHGRMHIFESDVEVLDNHPLAPAEVIVTSRGNKALPLTGYRTGDLGALSSVPCGCGSKWQWIESLQGRVIPLFRFASGELFSPTRFNNFLRTFPSVREFQVTLRQGRELVVRVEHLQPPDEQTLVRMSAFFSGALPPGVTVQMVEHTFDPHEKLARFRVVE